MCMYIGFSGLYDGRGSSECTRLVGDQEQEVANIQDERPEGRGHRGLSAVAHAANPAS